MGSALRSGFRYRSRWLRPRPLLGAIAVAALAGMASWRMGSEGTPLLAFQRVLPPYVRLPGKAPAMTWPREGEAALAVEGVGSFAGLHPRRRVPIASLAKVMTAYLVLRDQRLAPKAEGFEMRISAAEVREEKLRVALDQSTLRVKRGEWLSERQALEALMLPSANNVAALLAAHDAGSVQAFVARMNATARRLGMRSTTYTDPSGFDSGTVSTAADQLKLARVAMREPGFEPIVAAPSAQLPVVKLVDNANRLAGANGYVGVKTGSDEAAGGCLTFAKRIRVGGRPLLLLGVVLGQRGGLLLEAFASARRLSRSVAAALRVETALPAGTGVLSARNPDGERVAIATTTPVRRIGWAGLRVRVRVLTRRLRLRQLRAGRRLARVTVSGGSPAATAAAATRSLGGPSLAWRLLHLF